MLLSRFRSPLPKSPAAYRSFRPTRVHLGAAAVTAAAVLGLSGGAAHASVVSGPSLGSGTSQQFLGGSTPGLDLSNQGLTGQSPFAPATAPSPRPAPAAGHSATGNSPAGNSPAGNSPAGNSTAGQAGTGSAHAATVQAPVQSGGEQHGSSQQHGGGQHHGGRHHHSHAQSSGGTRPFEIYDSVTPTKIPAGQIVATYATGPFSVPSSQVAGRSRVFWIDVNGSDTSAAALDVEPGDATPSTAEQWAWHKLDADHGGIAVIYTMRSEWPAVQAAVSALPGWMHSHIRWWIADPTGYPHLVPGSNATQWYWGSNFDISTAQAGF
jgi:hypothetical protein